MLTLSLAITMKTLFSNSPTKVAISILMISMLSSLALFKSMFSSWVPYVLILTFSSGMMILFIYVTSLAPNEKTKTTKKEYWLAIPMVLSLPYVSTTPQSTKESMKTFSSQASLLAMMALLILTMIAITKAAFNPMQATSSSF